MQFSFSFSTLLASVFLVLLARHNASASPIARRQPKAITLPLKRIPQAEGIHPLVALQQQINRADKRLARMTGREPPTTAELTARLEKRINDLHEVGELNKFDKRYLLESNAKRFFHSPTIPVAEDDEPDTNSFAETDEAGDIPQSLVDQVVKLITDFINGNDSSEGSSDVVETPDDSTNDDASGDNNDTEAIGGPASAVGNVQIANDPDTPNSLGLNIDGPDVGYTATVQIGTPPRPFLLIMDSGSADLWVGSEQCRSENGGDCGDHQFLGPQSSSSLVETDNPFDITYGTGSVSGRIVQDSLSVAGLELNNHIFGVADIESVDFSDNSTPFDGLMGLARGQLANQRVPTPVEALADEGLIPDAITSYKISRSADNDNDGQITFGALDETQFDASTLVTLDNISPVGFYEAPIDAIEVDGQSLGLGEKTAIIDTGTTLIIAPAADVTAVLNQVPGSSQIQDTFTVPCDTETVLTLTFGGQAFDIQPQDLATGQRLRGNECLSGIQPGNIGGADTWLVGDVFLKNAYFSTDAVRNTMSLAKLV